MIVEFDSRGCYVKDKIMGELLLEGVHKDGLYEFTKNAKSHYFAVTAHQEILKSSLEKENWHRKLGYPSNRVLNKVLQLCNLKFKKDEIQFCESCQYGKLHNLLFPLSQSRSSCPLELIHSDVWGLPLFSLILVQNITYNFWTIIHDFLGFIL